MDVNAEISKKLVSFHKEIEEEYNQLIETFNIYAYGYGYKLDVLKDIFPGIFVIDFLDAETVMASRSLYEHFSMEPRETDLKKALRHINSLIRRDSARPIAILNAKKDTLDKIENIKVVLIQHRELYFSLDDLAQYNYVMRDLTTFVFEERKRAGISVKIDETLNIYDCVGSLSRKIFRIILKAAASRAEFSLREIFNKEKKKLLIVNYSSFREALSGFIDSNLLIEKSGIAKLNLNKKELAELISVIEKMK